MDGSGAPFSPPKAIAEGSSLAVVAPAGPFDRDKFGRGIDWLRQRYDVRFDDGIFAQSGFLAGDDGRRLAELRAAIRDPECDAIVCARGGYGTTRLLPGLAIDEIAAANKLLIGFSDITALHAQWARAGVRSLHAKMVADLGTSSDRRRQAWVEAVEGAVAPEQSWDLEPVDGSSGAVVHGRVFGGNLAILCALVGTPFAPPIDGCILVLEDVGERPYRVDRMMTMLEQAGWFDRVVGVVLGAFTEGDPGDDGVSLDDVLEERLAGRGLNVARGDRKSVV